MSFSTRGAGMLVGWEKDCSVMFLRGSDSTRQLMSIQMSSFTSYKKFSTDTTTASADPEG